MNALMEIPTLERRLKLLTEENDALKRKIRQTAKNFRNLGFKQCAHAVDAILKESK